MIPPSQQKFVKLAKRAGKEADDLREIHEKAPGQTAVLLELAVQAAKLREAILLLASLSATPEVTPP